MPVSSSNRRGHRLALLLNIGESKLWIRTRQRRSRGPVADRHGDRVYRDPLTGTWTRRGIGDHLDGLAALADRQGSPMFAAFVDVDRLTPANDAYGHDFGDEVLTSVASALARTVRGGDMVGRWGGDEFIVVGIGQRPDPDEYAMRIRRHLVEGGMDAAKWMPSVSVGVAAMDPPFHSLDRMLARADADMYDRRRVRRLKSLPASGSA
jgi:diguanylate cyclase